MKKALAALLGALLLLGLIACGGETFTDSELEVPAMKVQSASTTEDGKLRTACAAGRSPNDPLGQNQSPGLAWDSVDGAMGYVVVMFDEDANWLHWLATGLTETTLPQGAYTETDSYIGPYPPQSAGRHNYRIEVFAVEHEPDAIGAKMDAVNTYSDIVTGIDTSGGNPGNVLARGHITASYANGDNT